MILGLPEKRYFINKRVERKENGTFVFLEIVNEKREPFAGGKIPRHLKEEAKGLRISFYMNTFCSMLNTVYRHKLCLINERMNGGMLFVNNPKDFEIFCNEFYENNGKKYRIDEVSRHAFNIGEHDITKIGFSIVRIRQHSDRGISENFSQIGLKFY